MTSIQHLYLTCHGSWNTGPWVGEGAQFGVRLAIAETASSPAKGEVFTPVVNGDAVMDQGTSAGTHGTLTRTWGGRRGETGSSEQFDAGFQVGCFEDAWTFLDALKAVQSSAFRWTHMKMAPVSPAGKTIFPSSVYQLTTPIAGVNANTLPPQLAIAVSLRANVIGRRGRGRIYVPALSNGVVATDGTIVAATATTLRTALKTYVDNLQNLPGTPEWIPIVSIMSPGTATAIRPVEVRTGNRLDTIQSRRRQVAESYTVLAL